MAGQRPTVHSLEELEDLSLPAGLYEDLEFLSGSCGSPVEIRDLRDDVVSSRAGLSLPVMGGRATVFCEWTFKEAGYHRRAEQWFLVLQGELVVRWKALNDAGWARRRIVVPRDHWLRIPPWTPFMILPAAGQTLAVDYRWWARAPRDPVHGMVTGAEAAGPRASHQVRATFRAAAALRRLYVSLVEVHKLEGREALDVIRSMLPGP